MTEVEFHARMMELAWGLVVDTLGSLPKDFIEPKTKPSSLPGDPTVLMSKKDRYLKLLASKEGKWSRRDSDNVYVCQGPGEKAETYLMKKDGEDKVITVSFVSIRSRWNHIP